MDASTIILESSDIRIQFSSMSPVEVALTALQILKTAGNTNSFQEHFSKLIFVLRSKIAGHFVETAEMAVKSKKNIVLQKRFKQFVS